MKTCLVFPCGFDIYLLLIRALFVIHRPIDGRKSGVYLGESNSKLGLLLKILGIVGVISLIATHLVFGPDIAIALGSGMVLMTSNVALTGTTVRQFTSGNRGSMAGLYMVKMVILFGCLYALLAIFKLNIFGVIAGLSLPMMLMIFAGNRWMMTEGNEALAEGSES